MNIANLAIAPGYVQCACDKQAQIHLLCISSSSASGTVTDGDGKVIIDSPPVGIYEVTVFGVDNSSPQSRNFNESARFITKKG